MPSTGLSFRHMVIDSDNPADPHCKGAGDLSGNGFPDLLIASASGGGLYWYRYPEWSKHLIATGAFTTDMAVADVDGDGHLDAIIPNDEGLFWYRNPLGAGRDPAVGPWEGFNIGAEGARMHDVEAADLDGDGRIEIVTRHQSGFGKGLGNQLHLWKRVASGKWAHRTLPCAHGEGLALGDVNGNGRLDLAIGGVWFENPGDVLGGEWTAHPYIAEERFAEGWTRGDVVVQVGDIEGTGRPGIVLSPAEGSGRLSWFAPPGDPAAPDWQERVIEPDMDHAHGLGLADMDGSGRLDVVVAKMHQASAPQEVSVWLNGGGGASWSKHVVSTTGSHNIVLVDVGRTGRVDIYGANWNNRASTHGAAELWLNEGLPAQMS